MTIKYIPHLPFKATHTVKMITEMFRAIEARWLIQAEDIAGVFMRVLKPDGTKLGPDVLDIPAIREALSNPDEGGGLALTDLCVLCGMFPQFRDDTTLWIMPGQTLHRGHFKRQQNAEDTGFPVSINAAGSLIPGECPPLNPGTSGLDRDMWYAVYVDADAAGDPVYKITVQMPDYSGGYGPEHPTDNSLRFIGVFKTDDTADAFIVPFTFYADGWYFWREAIVGPSMDSDDTRDVLTTAAAGFVDANLSDWCPPCADAVKLTYTRRGGTFFHLRVKGDGAVTSGYEANDSDDGPGYELPVNVIDAAGAVPATAVEYDSTDDTDWLGVAAFHVPRD